MTKSTMTVVELLNNLVEINVTADRAATLWNVIMNDYFEKDSNTFLAIPMYYKEVQDLLGILGDYISSVNKAISSIASSVEPGKPIS